jgi:hypothetical protein
MMAPIAAALLSLAFFGIALVHLAWSLGSPFPAKTNDELADMVIGRPPMPGPAACLAVAIAAGFACALFVHLTLSDAAPFERICAGMIGVALAIRGIGGFFDTWLRPATRGSRYERLNRSRYSPLCIVMAVLVALVALR